LLFIFFWDRLFYFLDSDVNKKVFDYYLPGNKESGLLFKHHFNAWGSTLNKHKGLILDTEDIKQNKNERSYKSHRLGQAVDKYFTKK